MSQGQLTIEYIGLTLILDKFASGNFQRERIETPSIRQTRNGAQARDGTSFEPKHIWQIEAVITHEQFLILEAMHSAYLASPSALAVKDEIRLFSEPSPRTRSIVLGATETTLGLPLQVQYYAEFNAEFQNNYQVSAVRSTVNPADGKLVYNASFQLMETDKTTP